MKQDFDFLIGEWRIHNRFLKERLSGCNEWIEFQANSDVRPFLNGLGNVDRYTATRENKFIEGINLRLFNPSTGEWSLYWVDNVRAGILQPPIIGRFQEDLGDFYGDEEVHGRKVLCRFRWSRKDTSKPSWEQAFSVDEGKTWETNWVQSFTRAESRSARGLFPFEPETSNEGLLQTVQSWLKPPPRRMTFRVEGRTVVVQLQQLEWIEAQRDYVLLHIGKEKLLVRSTMSKLEAALDPNIFRRIHRSAIVNIDHVREIKSGLTVESTVIMRDGTALPLSRGSYESLLAALSDLPDPRIT